MSTPAELQSVQQPDHEQPISDEVIDLNTCMRLAASPYTVHNFPYQEAFEYWWELRHRRGADA